MPSREELTARAEDREWREKRDELACLRAENERLRAALERIANLDSPPDGRYAIIAREALR